MNSKPFKGKYLLPTILVICFSISLIARGGQKQPHQQKTTAQNITMAKIKMDVDKAMKEVDMEKIKAEVEKATKEIDVAKIEQEIKESIAKVDWDKIKEQMEEVKKVDMSKLDAAMKKLEIEMKD